MVRMVRMVRSLADRTFQLWLQPLELLQAALRRRKGRNDADLRALVEFQRQLRELSQLRERGERRHVRELLAAAEPGGSVHGERANFTGLVLGCIKAKFCKKICFFESSRRDLYNALLCTALKSYFF